MSSKSRMDDCRKFKFGANFLIAHANQSHFILKWLKVKVTTSTKLRHECVAAE